MEIETLTSVNPSQSKTSFANFFKRVQDAPWYQLFLTPAIDELQTLPAGSKVLDVGTGPGKFIELAQKLPLSYVGIDIDEAMLAQARRRPTLADVSLLKIEPNQPLPFDDAEFDAICFCSVLFLLENPYPLLNEALRVLQPGGRIVVLTPTGRGSFKNALAMLSKVNFATRNWTFFLWRNMTRFNAQRWPQKNILAEIAEKTHLDYSKHFGFGDFAVVEVMQKPAL